jgi:hypothetical protein
MGDAGGRTPETAGASRREQVREAVNTRAAKRARGGMCTA